MTPGGVIIVVAGLALVLGGCSPRPFPSETCRLERYRSRQISRSSFCSTSGQDEDPALRLRYASAHGKLTGAGVPRITASGCNRGRRRPSIM